MKLDVPIRIESTANLREHYMARARRAKAQRDAVGWCLRMTNAPDVPCTVKLIRIAPRKLDSHDNLRTAFKPAVDAIAEWLMLDDADPRITWAYGQEKGAPKVYACRIEIE